MIKKSQGNGENANAVFNNQTQAYEQIKELISVDILKTIQLLGFNYKVAIWEPLTLMLRNFIISKDCNTRNGRDI